MPCVRSCREDERHRRGIPSSFLPLPIARLDVAQSADIVALGDGLGQFQPRVKALADAVVAARGKIGGALCAPEINDVSCQSRKMRYNQIIAPPEAERTGGLL